ncbi:MAG: hypothetical protein M3Y55_15415, partial [Pseudomonadota bacterium]|nr:hypothetical protein [Pseudomonadota bacterium]
HRGGRSLNSRPICLTELDRLRALKERLTAVELREAILETELAEILSQVAKLRRIEVNGRSTEYVEIVRKLIDKHLLSQGEAFAAAAQHGQLGTQSEPDLFSAAKRMLPPPRRGRVGDDGVAQLVADVTAMVLIEPSREMQHYLRAFADAYTLFAFLKETPDVQSAIVKMFATGDIWLDTTVVLPLFAEELADDESGRRYTLMLAAARQAGLRLFVIPGVIQEIDRHMARCLTYVRTADRWRGRVPFLASAFALTGQARGDLPSWIERFRGASRPEDDIVEYLNGFFGIVVEDLATDAGTASIAMRGLVHETWREGHELRRSDHAFPADPNNTHKLIDHDVENYLGVAIRRRVEGNSPFGFTAWWMTLDRIAYQVDEALVNELGRGAPPSPIMSPDFMLNYLSIGPLRARVDRATEQDLPLAVRDLTATSALPKELLDAAEDIRERLHGQPEHMIRREVRDRLDAERRRIGNLTREGTEGVLDRIGASAGSANRG